MVELRTAREAYNAAKAKSKTELAGLLAETQPDLICYHAAVRFSDMEAALAISAGFTAAIERLTDAIVAHGGLVDDYYLGAGPYVARDIAAELHEDAFYAASELVATTWEEALSNGGTPATLEALVEAATKRGSKEYALSNPTLRFVRSEGTPRIEGDGGTPTLYQTLYIPVDTAAFRIPLRDANMVCEAAIDFIRAQGVPLTDVAYTINPGEKRGEFNIELRVPAAGFDAPTAAMALEILMASAPVIAAEAAKAAGPGKV